MWCGFGDVFDNQVADVLAKMERYEKGGYTPGGGDSWSLVFKLFCWYPIPEMGAPTGFLYLVRVELGFENFEACHKACRKDSAALTRKPTKSLL